jgi:hypothetical protein
VNRLLFLAMVSCSSPGASSDASIDTTVEPDAVADAASDSDATMMTDNTFLGMLLARNGTVLVRAKDGTPIDFRGAISCCMGGYGWPLFDTAWVDYVAPYKTTFLHMRVGPFLTGAGGEPDWAPTGGGYVETNGKADLASFNTKFWTAVTDRIAYAGKNGMWVEVDVADGWAVKHCVAGDLPGYSPWDPAFNVQGQDWCAKAGNAALVSGSVLDVWVRKVFEETGRFGNVIYQDGNELGLVPGYATAWSTSLETALRAVESQHGFPHHLFGTQSESMATIASTSIDFVELHQATAPMPSQCGGKPCLANEYNPDPALSPAALHQQFCAARANGTSFWYWRHGQTDAQMSATLALIQNGC